MSTSTTKCVLNQQTIVIKHSVNDITTVNIGDVCISEGENVLNFKRCVCFLCVSSSTRSIFLIITSWHHKFYPVEVIVVRTVSEKIT